jgi:S-DNA-T family DNA segregation ATPase FtsK/SpoIIIE
MSFHRPARFMPPATPTDKVMLPVPPEVRQSQNSLMGMMLPLLTSLGIAGYMLAYGRRRLIALAILFAVVAVASTVGMRLQSTHNEKRATLRQRSRYRTLLADTRARAREVASTQRMLAAWAHPAPDRLLAISESGRRVWERRQSDPDFLQVRLGVGSAQLSTPLQIGNRLDPMADYDWDSLKAARRLVDRVGQVTGQPFVLDIGSCGVLSILGPPERRAGVARALLSQIAVLHAPDDVMMVVDASGGDWEWTRWFPHTAEPDRRGPAGVVPLVAQGPGALADHLQRELDQRMQNQAARRMQVSTDRNAAPRQQRMVVLFSRFSPKSEWGRSGLLRSLLEAAGPQLGITLVFLGEAETDEPERVDVRLQVDGAGKVLLAGRTNLSVGASPTNVTADNVSRPLGELVARKLAPLTLNDEEDRRLARTVSFTETLIGPSGLEGDLTARWLPYDSERLLRVPLGTDGDGQIVVLDLKESAQGGSGPHGLIVGATGSGKSELLRTLVTGLALAHSPELLSFVMVDFKGGATFAQLTELPHVGGMITNLADDAALIERVQAALVGEQQRRQELLRGAGNLDSIREYHIRHAAGSTNTDGSPMEPMPYLMIIIDEFAELLSQVPEFVDLFVQIGRVGRSLGMHLLLATQKLEEGRLRGLDSHLSYRICLRTFSAQESRTVIGTTDAYTLPPIPGSAYLKVDERIYQRLRVAHVSAPYVSPTDRAANAGTATTGPLLLELRDGPKTEDEVDESDGISAMAGPGERTQLNIIVDRLRTAAPPSRQVWLPPLPPAVSLDLLLGPAATEPGRGFQSTMWQFNGSLKVGLGVVDLPLQQLQQPLIVDFAGPHGHLAVVGAPRSGRSTVLRTLMMSTMLTHTPDEAQFYCVDLGGETLHTFAAAPHVSGVAGRMDLERVVRLLSDVRSVIGAREHLFRELGVDSIAEFRARREAGLLPAGVRAADIFLLVDNWGSLRSEVDPAEPLVTDIAVRGLGVGVHVVLTTNRWMEIRPALRDSIGTRMELAIIDPSDSDVNRRMSKVMPKDIPGRALIPPGAFAHIVLPRLDGQDTDESLRTAQDEVIGRLAAEWSGAPAPAVRMLPERLTVRDLAPVPDRSPDEVAIGIGEPELQTVTIDLTRNDQHLLMLGDTGSGKTELLRTWMTGLTRQRSAWEVRIVLIDYRRSLLGVVPEDHLGAYGADANSARVYAQQVAEKLRERMPPPDVTPRQLKARDWWQGPDIYVVADDYDLVGGGQQAPLMPLLEFVPHARDIGLHLVLARRVAGMTRAQMTDTLLTRVRELGCTGIVLSGDPREGHVMGAERAAQRPPGRGVLVRRGRPTALFHAALEDDGDGTEGDEYDDADDSTVAASSRA